MNGGERSRGRATAASLIIALAPPAALRAGQQADLTTLSLEQLLQTKVISVSKQEETRLATPAAVHVVTGADVVQSGARTLPDALRLSPGVHVARNTASQWAIGIRGFTGTLARAQLALIDGRSVYTPLFAGTYWDVQDVLLDDLERIEVVRGPGGTLWGANAVNGIVNVITKSAWDTQGGLVAAGGGNEEHVSLRGRYGGRLGDAGAYRVYGKYFDRDAAFHPEAGDFDDWHQYRAGVRTDWRFRGTDTLSVQGEAYGGRSGQRTSYAVYSPPFGVVVEQDARLAGGHLLARWTRSFGSGSSLAVQTYYDRTEREVANFQEDRDTVDVDGQYRFLAGRHEMVAGAGARLSRGRTGGVPSVVFDPAAKTDELVTAFVQDSYDAVPGRLRVVVGTKLERNDYTGVELQPSARVLWRPAPRHSLWAAVTRAVRTPSRVERDLSLTVALSPGTPAFARVIGSDRFTTERALSFEAGYRAQPGQRFVVDMAVFHTRYPNLLSLESGAPFLEGGFPIVPFRIANGLRGRVSGLETAADTRPAEWLVLRAGHDYLNMALEPAPGSADTTSAVAEDASPRHRLHLRATLRPPRRAVSLDARWRWVARLPSQDVPAYSELDVRLAWQLRERLELAVAGRNLLHSHHAEFGSLTRVERSVFAEATWAW